MQVADLISGMTERQASGVQARGGCTILTAGAGAGKTKVLTSRIAWILRCMGSDVHTCTVPPVVAITFTRDAANEMHSRIDGLIGAGLSRPLSKVVVATTFHSFALNRIIKPNLTHAFFKKHGLKSKFSLASERDILHAMSSAIEEGLTGTQKKHLKRFDGAVEFNEWLSLTRAFGYTPQSYLAEHGAKYGVKSIDQLLANKEQVPDVSPDGNELSSRDIVTYYYLKAWFHYVRVLRGLESKGMVDFDEILVLATHFLEQHPKERKLIKSLYKYLLVDEFQDANNCQFRFVLALSGDGSRLSLFGDIKQAIYGFRGSNPELFAHALEVYSNHSLVNLPDNFRSVDQIVAVGNALANDMRLKMVHEPMIARNMDVPIEPVTIHCAANQQAEAEWVADKMLWLRDRGIDFPQMKVLYRFRKLADVLENELLSRNIPCRRVGGNEDKSLYEDKRIIDIVLYLHLLFNPSSKQAMRRLLCENSQYGFNSQTYSELTRSHGLDSGHAVLQHLLASHYPAGHIALSPLNELAKDVLSFSAKLERLKTFDHFCLYNNRQYQGLPVSDRVKVVEEMGGRYLKEVAVFIDELMNRYLNHFYLPFMTKNARDNHVQREKSRFVDDFRAVCSTLYSHTKMFDGDINLHDYFCSRPLLNPNIQKKKDENVTDVELMTTHACKGLEAEAVFVVGCVQERWFREKLHQDSPQYDEERRLFYVACTRPRKQLYLSHYEQFLSRDRAIDSNPVDFLAIIGALDNINHIR